MDIDYKNVGVSILIVNYNGAKYLKNLLDSIHENFHNYNYNYEILIIDNNSDDNSEEIINKLEIQYDKIKAIRSSQNLGFGKGNNYLLQYANYNTLMLVNNDTHIINLKQVFDYLNNNPILNKEVISVKILNKDLSRQNNVFSYPVTIKLISELFLLKHLLKSFFKKKINFTSPNKIYYSGCFLILGKQLFSTIGGFDEDFYFYHEEADLFLRLESLGINKIYFESDEIMHYGGRGGLITIFSFCNYYIGLYKLFKKHNFNKFVGILNFIFISGFYFRIILSSIGISFPYSPFTAVYNHHQTQKRSNREVYKLHLDTIREIRKLF